ncbi:MAG: sigma-54 interaction domain-containing protein, partial [Acidobacteriota bacterium]
PRHYAEMERELAVKSSLILCFPLILSSGEVYGAVELIDTSERGARLNLDEDYLELLSSLVAVGSVALGQALAFESKSRECNGLKLALDRYRALPPIVGDSLAVREALAKTAAYARTDFPVLITGESGTGKELFAQAIHQASGRRDKPFLVQNCSCLPDGLLESELFGCRKGAFTGADRDRAGLFEAADGGTVFLDEIGDMPAPLQAKILRVLQSGEVKPLGAATARTVDVRIVSATNRDLAAAMAAGDFREDLYYRLNVLPLHLPPLRERPEDVPALLEYFLKRDSLRLGLAGRRVAPEALAALTAWPWKGNIREMENLVKYLLTVAEGPVIALADLPAQFRPAGGAPGAPSGFEPAPGESAAPLAGRTWEELERAYALELLEDTHWNVSRAAKRAGLNRSTFDSRLKKLGIAKS